VTGTVDRIALQKAKALQTAGAKAMLAFLYEASKAALAGRESMRDSAIERTAWRYQRRAGVAVANNMRRLGASEPEVKAAEHDYGVAK
jgi:hypothetical protein